MPFPPPGDLPHPGIEHTSFPSPALTGGFFTDSATWGAQLKHKVKESVGGSVMPDSFQPHGLQPARLLCPWDFPDKNTRVGCHALFQGIFLTQGSNPSTSLVSPALAGRFFTSSAPWEAEVTIDGVKSHRLTSRGTWHWGVAEPQVCPPACSAGFSHSPDGP